jgi:hypothetical protein
MLYQLNFKVCSPHLKPLSRRRMLSFSQRRHNLKAGRLNLAAHQAVEDS